MAKVDIVRKLRKYGRASEDELENFRQRLFQEQDQLFVTQDRLIGEQENLREQMRHFK